MIYLFKNSKNLNLIINLVRCAVVVVTFFRTIRTSEVAWNLGDIGVGMMAWINIVAIILLTKPALATLKDYEAQKKMVIYPVFIPKRCGIKDVEIWDDIIENNYPEKLAALKEKVGNVKTPMTSFK